MSKASTEPAGHRAQAAKSAWITSLADEHRRVNEPGQDRLARREGFVVPASLFASQATRWPDGRATRPTPVSSIVSFT